MAHMKTADAIKLFGNTQSDLARALGITASAVNQWGEEVPPLRAYQIRDLIAERERTSTPSCVCDQKAAA